MTTDIVSKTFHHANLHKILLWTVPNFAGSGRRSSICHGCTIGASSRTIILRCQEFCGLPNEILAVCYIVGSAACAHIGDWPWNATAIVFEPRIPRDRGKTTNQVAWMARQVVYKNAPHAESHSKDLFRINTRVLSCPLDHCFNKLHILLVVSPATSSWTFSSQRRGVHAAFPLTIGWATSTNSIQTVVHGFIEAKGQDAQPTISVNVLRKIKEQIRIPGRVSKAMKGENQRNAWRSHVSILMWHNEQELPLDLWELYQMLSSRMSRTRRSFMHIVNLQSSHTSDSDIKDMKSKQPGQPGFVEVHPGLCSVAGLGLGPFISQDRRWHDICKTDLLQHDQLLLLGEAHMHSRKIWPRKYEVEASLPTAFSTESDYSTHQLLQEYSTRQTRKALCMK